MNARALLNALFIVGSAALCVAWGGYIAAAGQSGAHRAGGVLLALFAALGAILDLLKSRSKR